MPELEVTDPSRSLPAAGRAARTYLLLAAFVLLRAFGNLCLAWGTKHFPETLGGNPWAYLRVLLNPFVTLGIVMMIVAIVVRLALLAVADLSYVLPMTAIGYVLAALFGSVFLHEVVSAQHWTGTVLIFAGVALVSSTSQNTTQNTTQLHGNSAGKERKSR